MVRYERIRLPSRVDGRELPPVELVGMAGTAGPLHERTREALDARPPAGREGDRPAQPPRMVELPLVPRPARASGSARTATSRSCCTARSARCRATTAATASRRRGRARTAARPRWPATARAPSSSSASWRSWSRRCPSSGSTPTRRRPRAWRRCCARFDEADAGVLVGHADGRQGPRLPGRDARRGAGRRRHAPLPRLPRRGAHLRAGGPAGRPERPRRARRPRDRAGARPDGRGAPLRRPPRRRRLPRGRARPPRAARLPAARPPDQGGVLVDRGGARGRRGEGDPRPRVGRPACPRSVPRRSSAARRATAPSSWSARDDRAARDRRRSARRSRRWPRCASTRARASRWTSIRSSDRSLASGVKLGRDGGGARGRGRGDARGASTKRMRRSSIPRPRRAAWRRCRSSASSAIRS